VDFHELVSKLLLIGLLKCLLKMMEFPTFFLVSPAVHRISILKMNPIRYSEELKTSGVF